MKKKTTRSRDARPLYHYTVDSRLKGILKDGVIKTTDAQIASVEKPAVWLSYEPHWEASANKLYQPPGGGPVQFTSGIEEMAQYSTPARIEIDPSGLRLMKWEAFRVLSGMPKKTADALETLPKDKGGSPDMWRASLQPVPESAWLKIEIYRDGHWYEFDDEQELPRRGIATGTVPIDYSAIRSLREFREAVDGARVVLARDKRTGKTSIIYGLEMIRVIASELVPQQALHTVEFEIDMHTDELEHLVAAVQTVYGFHEYVAGGSS